jgi:copper chaperone CopZ
MEDSITTEKIELPVEGMGCQSCVERIRSTLSKVPGIENLQVEIGKVRFEYYPQAINLRYIQDQIARLGYTIPGKVRSRNPFRRFLSRMTEENEKAFGSEHLDCCTMKKK